MVDPEQPENPERPLVEHFGPRNVFGTLVLAVLAMAVLVPFSYLFFGADYLGLGDIFNENSAFVISALIFLILPVLLVIIPGNTHWFRDLIGTMWVIIGSFTIAGGVITIANNPMSPASFYGLGMIASGGALIVSATLILPPFLAFGVPSNWISMWLMFLATFLFINPLGILASIWMPPHRRLNYLWKPKWLPRLPRHGGFTLIELLVTIAVLSIFAYGFVHVSQVAHRTAERQQRWREATALAVDAIADLRSQNALPPDGVHAIGGAAAELHPELKDRATITLSSAGVPGVRLAEVTVTLDDELDKRVVKLAALIAEGVPR